MKAPAIVRERHRAAAPDPTVEGTGGQAVRLPAECRGGGPLDPADRAPAARRSFHWSDP